MVLIFDEVITGFRVAPGGAQSLLGVKPDLATFGKAVAGGFPLSVRRWRPREIMQLVEERRVMHAGTFNGNPISLAAADATLTAIARDGGAALEQARSVGAALMEGIGQLAQEFGIATLINGVGTTFNVAFTTRGSMQTYRDTLEANTAARDVFVEAMLTAGVYLLPDGRWYVSTVHSEQDVLFTLEAVRNTFSSRRLELLADS